MFYKFNDRVIQISQVTRYHEEPGPYPQTIAAHSWGVAWIIGEFHPNPSISLLRAALEHDLPEHLTSDLSFQSKRRFPQLVSAMDSATELAEDQMGILSTRKLTEEELWWLRWADLLEAALWCRYQVQRLGVMIYLERWKGCEEPMKKMLARAPRSFTTSPMPAHFSSSIFLQSKDP